MTTKLDSHFQTVISGIREQLESNKELIQQSDAVFICGGSNTCLTSTALLVGNMINLFKIEQASTTKQLTSLPPLTVVNSEMFTSDLSALGYSIGLPVDTKFLHVFNNVNSEYLIPDPFSSIDKTNIVGLLKRSTCVIVDDKKYESIINNVLRYKLLNKELTSIYIQVVRLNSISWLDHEDEINVLQNKFSPTGLKVVFIETAKNKKTGIVDLVFHTRVSKYA